MNLPSSLSKLLITAVVFYYRSWTTSAQDFCGHIGDINETKYMANKKEMFYLDQNNPACCTGNIMSWRVCYYRPESESNKQYTVKYAVYRRNETDYIQVSNLIFNTTLSLSGDDERKKRHDREPHYETLNCHNELLDTPFTVQEGDVIGACVFNPMGKIRQLNIVSKITGHSHGLQLYVANSCRMGKNLNFPAIITANELSAVSSMRLHLSANISKFVPPC